MFKSLISLNGFLCGVLWFPLSSEMFKYRWKTPALVGKSCLSCEVLLTSNGVFPLRRMYSWFGRRFYWGIQFVCLVRDSNRSRSVDGKGDGRNLLFWFEPSKTETERRNVSFSSVASSDSALLSSLLSKCKPKQKWTNHKALFQSLNEKI